MREHLFPRWCTALFALLPMSELLYLLADGQSVYAAALACAVCALVGAGAAKLSGTVRRSAPAQWILSAAALFPLLASIARMSLFLQKTVFTARSCGGTVVLLTVCVLLTASMGLNRCAMWALPVAWLAGVMLVLSSVLTLSQLTLAHFAAPTAAFLPQFWHILSRLLPVTAILALSLPEDRLSAGVSRGLSAGGALLALLLLRTILLLSANTAALLPYPAFTAAGLAAIGDFARHGEVFFAVPLILCEVGRCAALLCVLLYPFTRTYGVLHLHHSR